MANTYFGDTGRGGAWHLEVDSVTKVLPTTKFVPTGGWRPPTGNGHLGAILSNAYAQQSGLGAISSHGYPAAATLPGYWQSSAQAGGTVEGQGTRAWAFGEEPNRTASALKLAQLDAQVAKLTYEGKHQEAAAVATEASALRATLSAGGKDWMTALFDITGKATEAYRTSTIMPQTPKTPEPAQPRQDTPPAPRKMPAWLLPVGIGVAVLAVVGFGR